MCVKAFIGPERGYWRAVFLENTSDINSIYVQPTFTANSDLKTQGYKQQVTYRVVTKKVGVGFNFS